MKPRLITALLTITLTFIAIGQVKNTGAVTSNKAEQEIKLVERKRTEALLRGDTATLDRILADEYISTNQLGEVQTKAQIVANLNSGALKVESLEENGVIVRIYGITAVLTGRATTNRRVNDQLISGQIRFTRVYVKRAGRWQTVAHQVTRIAQQ